MVNFIYANGAEDETMQYVFLRREGVGEKVRLPIASIFLCNLPASQDSQSHFYIQICHASLFVKECIHNLYGIIFCKSLLPQASSTGLVARDPTSMIELQHVSLICCSPN